MKLYPIFFILFIFSFFRSHFYISDEAVNLQMVKNMKSYGSELMVRPSYDPGGHKDWEKESLVHILMTPVFHYMNLLFNKLLNLNLIQSGAILQALFFATFFLFLLRPLGLLDQSNIFFFSIAPITYFLLIEHEGAMTLFGFLSLLTANRGLEMKKSILFACSGIFLGVAFLLKLWLIGPFGIGLIFVLINSILKREFTSFNYIKFCLILIISFILTSSIHLLFVYFYAPEDIFKWVNQVYIGVITGAGDYGAKSNNNAWGHPWYYYIYCALRDLLPILPFAFILLKRIIKGEFRTEKPFYVGCLGVCFSIIFLSALSSKEPSYILPIYFGVSLLVMEMLRKNNVFSKIEMKISILSIVPLFLFSILAINGKYSNTLTIQFMILSSIAFFFSLILIFNKSVIIKKLDWLMPMVCLLLSLYYIDSNSLKKIDPVVNFINEREKTNIKNMDKARETYIIANYYSQIGFNVWNRVLKYDWLVKSSNAKAGDYDNLVSNSKIKYFVLENNQANSEMIKASLIKSNFDMQRFEDLLVYYR